MRTRRLLGGARGSFPPQNVTPGPFEIELTPATIQTSGNNVTGWNDVNGNATNNFALAAGNATVGNTTLNGFAVVSSGPTVRFQSTFQPGVGPLTVIVVAQSQAPNNNLVSCALASQLLGFEIQVSGGAWFWLLNPGGSKKTTARNANWHVFGIQFNNNGSLYCMLDTLGANVGAYTFNGAQTGIAIGDSSGNGGLGGDFRGNITHVFITNVDNYNASAKIAALQSIYGI